MEDFKRAFNIKKNDIYKKVQPKIKQNAEIHKASRLDKKRQLTYKEKANVWMQAKKAIHFDNRFFRLDIVDCLVIKDIKYNNNIDNYIFAVEYEHFVSHSNNGRTTERNISLLNAEINRKKQHKALYEHNLHELHGLQTLYGITERTLLYELETDLHNTCHKYNLLFIYKVKGNYWTLRLNENGVYRSYNDEYIKHEMEEQFDIKYYKKEIKKLKKLVDKLQLAK